MTFASLLDALALPGDVCVQQRVPKKLLLEQGASTAADKRQIQDGIEEIVWVAALKPNNIGVPAFKDEQREYLEIAVLTVELRDGARAPRLIELIHRAIPYPVVLWSEQDGVATLSLAHKRWSQGQAGEVVVEEVHRTASCTSDALTQLEAAFLGSLAVSGLPTRDLYALYQGWLDRVVAFEASTITGAFAVPETAESAAIRQEALADHARLERDVVALRARAAKEKQLNRRVDLNMTIKRLEAQQARSKRVLRLEGSV